MGRMVLGCIEPRIFLNAAPGEQAEGYKGISSPVMQELLTHDLRCSRHPYDQGPIYINLI
jgi:hypothetical protein